jgi:metal-responsive CopG/Arc/MetJ family transcriptional regulator
MTEKEKIRLVLDVTPSLNEAINQAISQDSHSTRSEFIREAVRDKLKGLGYKPKIDFSETPKTKIEA